MPEEDCERIEVAGLLHDLGKLHIPDEILEAPRGLSDSEWHQMRTHSYLTYEILKPLEAIAALAHWAAGHHERLNGTGYPYRIQEEELPLPMRILAVADIFQALAQQRPYREASPPTEVLQALDGLVAEQAVDGNVVDIVRAQLEACQRAAFGGFGSNGGGKGTETVVLA
jgi:HD-GYP domain-containing protein (c-di-GMP phosphodiesterase class II)